MARPIGIDAMVLSATVAHRYFIDQRSKSQIAEEFALSRFRVARMLERAIESGFVRLELDFPIGEVDVDLSSQLQQRYGLRHALVVSAEGGVLPVMDAMGRACVRLLREISEPDDILGFAWTKAVAAMIPHLGQLKAQAAVQLCGAFPGAGTGPNSIDLVRDVAKAIDGRACMYYAPLIASDRAAAEGIRRQPDFLSAQAMLSDVTKGVVGLGAWEKGLSAVADAVTDEERANSARDGFAIELSGSVSLDRNGDPVETELSERLIGISAVELARVPEVIGVVFGQAKADALHTTITSGWVNSVVTHSSVAHRLLAR